MNCLFIDHPGSALDLSLRAQEAGHSVRHFIGRDKEDSKWLPVGDGLVEKVRNWQASMDWADLIILCDNVKEIREIDAYRRKGYPIFGPSYAGAKLELDREAGQKFLNDCGIETIPYEIFKNYDIAERYVRSTMKRYVSKPSGDADKALSYVSKSPADMIFMLRRWKENNKLKGDFLLQEFREGIEIAVGGWLGPNGFLPHFYENFEIKKLMNGDHGPNTGQTGEVSRYVKNSLLARKMLLPCEQDLVRLGITGYVDLNTIVDDDGNVWPMEFTVRPGYPPLNLQASLHQGDPVQWMADLLEGNDTLEVSEEICTGIVLAIPDFPYSHLTKKEVTGFPIYGYRDVDPNDMHPCEIMQGIAPAMEGDEVVDQEMWVTAGDYVLVVTGRADTVSGSIDAAYANMDKIEMPNSPIYRTDLGEKCKEELPRLIEMGYCESWPEV